MYSARWRTRPNDQTVTWAPAAPARLTCFRARSMPWIPPDAYRQPGSYEGKLGGRIRHVGAYSTPSLAVNVCASKALLTARRTLTSSNGGMRVLRKKYSGVEGRTEVKLGRVLGRELNDLLLRQRGAPPAS